MSHIMSILKHPFAFQELLLIGQALYKNTHWLLPLVQAYQAYSQWGQNHPTDGSNEAQFENVKTAKEEKQKNWIFVSL